MTELDVQTTIRNELASEPGLMLFRANLMGVAWAGKIESQGRGMVLLSKARPIASGLPDGFSDLFGMYRGRFVAIEVKRDSRSKPKAQQIAFLRAIHTAGGFAGVARSTDDARRILAGELVL